MTHEATRLADVLTKMVNMLAEGLADQQAMPDDSWRPLRQQIITSIDALAALAQPAPTAEVALPAVSEEAEQGFWMAPMMLDMTMLKAAANTPGMKAIDSSSATMQLRGYPLDPKAFEGGAPLAQAWIAMRDSWLARAQSAAKGDAP